ncbi:EAL domain-containing protein [Sphingopyxis sp. LARHCG72]
MKKASLVVRIDNHDQIAAAYGESAIVELGEAIRRRLQALAETGCNVSSDGRYVEIAFLDLPAVCAMLELPGSKEAFGEYLLLAIALQPFAVSGTLLCAQPSLVEPSVGEARAVAGDSRDKALRLAPAAGGYRDDMRRAAELYEALRDGRVALGRQAVRHASTTDRILYHECLVRVAEPTAGLHSPADFIPALERLQLVRAFDSYIVARVLAELEASPDLVLAANISAQSAVDDLWWYSLKRRLQQAPEVASRLVIEITETAELTSVASAVAFASAMRMLGCRIALDDFGMGNASLQRVIALAPDMIKVDAFYVRWAEEAPNGLSGIAHLVGLLESLAPIVIVEGVETPAQSTMMIEAGAVWQQGYCHGRPMAFGRPEFC